MVLGTIQYIHFTGQDIELDEVTVLVMATQLVNDKHKVQAHPAGLDPKPGL